MDTTHVVDPSAMVIPEDVNILAGLPTYDGTRFNGNALGSLILSGVNLHEAASSLLAASFNRCWARALNGRKDGVTHFLLMHADVCPLEFNWVQQLWREFALNNCQVLSAAIPIKSPHGLTSTGWETGDKWRPRRLSMTEIMSQPVTWTHPKLLVNTGLLLVDMRQPWVEKICFTINDRISQDAEGRWVVDVESEDWNFSRQCRELGVPVHVTRKIRISHMGKNAWRNDVAWGQAHDPNMPEPIDFEEAVNVS